MHLSPFALPLPSPLSLTPLSDRLRARQSPFHPYHSPTPSHPSPIHTSHTTPYSLLFLPPRPRPRPLPPLPPAHSPVQRQLAAASAALEARAEECRGSQVRARPPLPLGLSLPQRPYPSPLAGPGTGFPPCDNGRPAVSLGGGVSMLPSSAHTPPPSSSHPSRSPVGHPRPLPPAASPGLSSFLELTVKTGPP